MKLLLDTCLSPRTRDALVAAGHDAIWTGDWNPDPGDEAILFAQREARILVTLDKDFGELAVVTWNSTHIANAEFRPKVESACRDNGYEPPVLCTPDELMGT